MTLTKRLLPLTLLILGSFSVVPAQQASAAGGYYTTSVAAPMRDGYPGPAFQTIPAGTSVYVECQIYGGPWGGNPYSGNGTWNRVYYNGKVGYVSDVIMSTAGNGWMTWPTANSYYLPTNGIPTCSMRSNIDYRSTGASVRADASLSSTVLRVVGGTTPLEMLCWKDGDWATVFYSSNRWFRASVAGPGSSGFIHSSLVVNQTGVGPCS
jgi:hypothetical protein